MENSSVPSQTSTNITNMFTSSVAPENITNAEAQRNMFEEEILGPLIQTMINNLLMPHITKTKMENSSFSGRTNSNITDVYTSTVGPGNITNAEAERNLLEEEILGPTVNIIYLILRLIQGAVAVGGNLLTILIVCKVNDRSKNVSLRFLDTYAAKTHENRPPCTFPSIPL